VNFAISFNGIIMSILVSFKTFAFFTHIIMQLDKYLILLFFLIPDLAKPFCTLSFIEVQTTVVAQVPLDPLIHTKRRTEFRKLEMFPTRTREWSDPTEPLVPEVCTILCAVSCLDRCNIRLG
jgi:hypothetical protein